MSVESVPHSGPNPETLAAQSERDQALQTLLGIDYEFARDSGLIDMFYYDPETGEDGLLHTLIGDKHGGFHSESAVELLRENPATEHLVKRTGVDREHLSEKNSEQRRPYAEKPFEPYLAHVAVKGLVKMETVPSGSDGGEKTREVKAGMFPREYDPLAIMQGIRIAYDTRDKEQDVAAASTTGDSLVNSGALMPQINGSSEQPVRLVLEAETQKVRAAIPIVKKSARMKLTEQEARQHLID